MLKYKWLSLLLAAVVLLGTDVPAQAQKKKFKDGSSEFTRDNPKIRAVFREVVAKASQSTVRVLCNGKETALGMVIGPDGWVLTKANDLVGKVSCKLKDGREFPARVVGWHEKHDLALLKIEVAGLPFVELTEGKAAVGHWIACAGPAGEAAAIGIVGVAKRDLPNKAGLAPPPNSGYLGVGLEPGDGGVRIMQVLPGSAAAKAGLKANDLVVAFNGKMVAIPEDLIKGVQKHKIGDQITLKIKRAKEELELKATLGKRPPNRGDFQNSMGSALSKRRGGFGTVLQHDAVIKPSDCGGPLVDLDGRVIGVNICRAGRTESYAIPAEVIKPLLFDLMAGKLPPPSIKELPPTPPFGQQLADAEAARQKLAKEMADTIKKLADSRAEQEKLRLRAENLQRQLEKAQAELKKHSPATPAAKPSQAEAAQLDKKVEQVLKLMHQRLEIMVSVARWKWRKSPIEDAKRENEFLQKLVDQAQEQKLDVPFTDAFFASQLGAAKLLQQNLFDTWKKTNAAPFAKIPDLHKDLRPNIDKVSRDLLIAVHQLRPHLGEERVKNQIRLRARAILQGEGIDDHVRAAALRILVK